MKKALFYVLAIVLVIALFSKLWSLGIAVIALMAAFFITWLQNGHHRFLEIKDKFLSFNEMIITNSLLTIQLQKSYQALIENIANLEKEKTGIEPGEKKKLKQTEKAIMCLKNMSSTAQFFMKKTIQMLDTTHSMSAILLRMNYEEYLKEDWLYRYRPLEDVLQLMYAKAKIGKTGTFLVRLEQVRESEKGYLTKFIKSTCNLSLKEAKNKVDAVRLGSMSILIENISESQAHLIKFTLELWGGKVSVIEKEKIGKLKKRLKKDESMVSQLSFFV